MRYFLIAGEASGDLHASALMRELKIVDAQAEFSFLGGEMMQAQGGKLVQHYKKTAFMGFFIVLRNISKVLNTFKLCKMEMADFNPDAVILVDYPGFNLRMAKFAKTILKKPVFYYIPPKIWAWKENRIKKIKKYVDSVFAIFPFEPDFYLRHNFKVEYVGNPTVEYIANCISKVPDFNKFCLANELAAKPVIALLPGSRKQEIAACLPRMIKAASRFDDYQIVVSGAPGIDSSFYLPFSQALKIPVITEQTSALVYHATAAIVNSGTATLETALIGTPQVVVYHVNFGKIATVLKNLFLKVKYISLVNLIANRHVVKELVADEFTLQNLSEELNQIINNPNHTKTMLRGYKTVKDILGEGNAAENTARKIFSIINVGK